MNLYLNHNLLSGSLLLSQNAFPKLRYLDLHNNLLCGPIPPQLLTLPKLEILNLNNNNLTGNLPPEIYGQGTFVMVSVSHNPISGNLPPLPFNSSIVSLDIGFTNLTGDLYPLIAPLIGFNFIGFAALRFSNLLYLSIEGNQHASVYTIINV
jgi:hypothetical protein